MDIKQIAKDIFETSDWITVAQTSRFRSLQAILSAPRYWNISLMLCLDSIRSWRNIQKKSGQKSCPLDI